MSNHKRHEQLKDKKNGYTKRDALTGKVVRNQEVVVVENAPEYLRTLGYRVIPPAVERLVLTVTSFFIFVWLSVLAFKLGV